MELYFAYGSNMSTTRLQARVDAARALGRAFVDGWQLTFDKPGRDGTGKANLSRALESRTWGVLFEIPAAAWSVLDGYEPGYVRNVFRFERSNRDALIAHTYVFPGVERAAGGAPSSPPSREYLEHLLVGAREHDLPEEHIRLIESFRT